MTSLPLCCVTQSPSLDITFPLSLSLDALGHVWAKKAWTHLFALEGGVVDATDARVESAGSCTDDLALRSPTTEGDREASLPIGGSIGRVSTALDAAFA